MKVTWLFVVVCGAICLGLVTGLTREEYDKWEAKWRKILCEKATDDLIKDLEGCVDKEEDEISAVFEECQIEAYPEDEDTAKYMRAACADKSIFATYDKCMEPHIEDESFLKKIEESEEALECYIEVMEKHGLFTEELKLKK